MKSLQSSPSHFSLEKSLNSLGFFLVPLHGFEPRLTDPESVVLPLDDRGM